MRTWTSVAVLFIGSVGGVSPAAAQMCPLRDRAIWVYQNPDVVGDTTERDNLFTFASAPDRPISDFFLSVRFTGPCLTESGSDCSLAPASYRQNLRDLISQAHAQNIRVHALSGNPTLTLIPVKARARAQAILAFNNASGVDARFDSVHLDVEPYLLDGRLQPDGTRPTNYVDDPIGTIVQWLDMNASVVAVLGGILNYGVDVPDFWHPYINEFGVLDERLAFKMTYNSVDNYPIYHLLALVSDVTIMSYHRDPDAIRRKTEFAMVYAATSGAARVYVGVQTAPSCVAPETPAGCRPAEETLGNLTVSAMETALCTTVDSALAGFSSFRGFSFY